MPGMPGSLDQAGCPRYAPDHGVQELVSAGQGLHSNPLQSRERRFESCQGHSNTASEVSGRTAVTLDSVVVPPLCVTEGRSARYPCPIRARNPQSASPSARSKARSKRSSSALLIVVIAVRRSRFPTFGVILGCAIWLAVGWPESSVETRAGGPSLHTDSIVAAPLRHGGRVPRSDGRRRRSRCCREFRCRADNSARVM
jgi:hypothetical protein